MKTCKEIATEWGLSERAVLNLCAGGRIPGAYKEGRSWRIPDDSVRPADGRVSSGKYKKSDSSANRKPLPVGISDYVRAQSDYYYVDKTMLIREFLDRRPLVSLFTRPRRFGKTLNMDMLRVFFELSEDDTSVHFRDKYIWKCGEKYTRYQGKYPVIFFTFKDIKFSTWDMTISRIRSLVQAEFARHRELENNTSLAGYERDYYSRIINGDVTEAELAPALENLTRMLSIHHGTKTIVIVDEYDTPIQEGFSRDFYDEITGFMRNFFSGAFKDNRYLEYGFLTGVLKISQESIFSGLNNLTVNTILDDDYCDCFGFTYPEVRELLSYYGITDKEDELKDWYNGYLFGNKEIYNPWSVINYIYRGCIPMAYWVNTGKNEILEDVLRIAPEDVTEKLYALFRGETVVAGIDLTTVYRLLTDDPSNIYSVLMVAGYLKAVRKELQSDGSFLCEIAIPNREIATVYKAEILSYLADIGAIANTTANMIAESLYRDDMEKLRGSIEEYLMRSVSFYDTGSESFYHGLFLGLVAMMDNQYKIRSNRESGEGRYDICMFPKSNAHAGIIIEVKWGRELDEDALVKLADEALIQIDDKAYETEMQEDGAEKIIKFGIAFSGKNVAVRSNPVWFVRYPATVAM